MIFVVCPFLKTLKCLEGDEGGFETVEELRAAIHFRTGIPGEFFSVFNNRGNIRADETIPDGSTMYLGLSLHGGKGGFGSMLRAIGAQIEKTTNREACRDLTGRRLRDINEEQRLKKWLAKKAERELEKQRRKKERLERMKQQPKHDFHDPEYNKQRSELPERIDDALTKGLKKLVPVLSKKRNIEDVADDEYKEILKKQCRLLGVDMSSESDSSDQESLTNSDSNSRPMPESSEDTSESFSACSSSTNNMAGMSAEDSCSTSSKSKNEFSDGVVFSEETNTSSREYSEDSSSFPSSSSAENSMMLKGEIDELDATGNHGVVEAPVSGPTNEKPLVPAADVHQNTSVSASLSSDASCDLTSNNEGNQEGKTDLQASQENSNTSFEKEDISDVDLMSFGSVQELEDLGLDRLKSILMSLGLKCGGTLPERAQRLWSVRGLTPDNYPASLKAKPKKK